MGWFTVSNTPERNHNLDKFAEHQSSFEVTGQRLNNLSRLVADKTESVQDIQARIQNKQKRLEDRRSRSGEQSDVVQAARDTGETLTNALTKLGEIATSCVEMQDALNERRETCAKMIEQYNVKRFLRPDYVSGKSLVQAHAEKVENANKPIRQKITENQKIIRLMNIPDKPISTAGPSNT